MNTGKQTGSALIVAIVLIFMLSIMGVSTMRGSTLERRMATNAIHASTTFQVSESVTEIVLNDTENLGDAFDLDGAPLDITINSDFGNAISTDATLQYVGDGAAMGYSLGVGSNNFMALRYQVDGRAEIRDVRSFSSVTQGAYRVVPAP